MPGLFLSHSSTDKAAVRKLALDLIARGIPVWFDSWEMDVGARLTERIYDGIAQSDAFVIVLSPAAVESSWVDKELQEALEHAQLGKHILPVRLLACQPPHVLGDYLFADFKSSYHGGLNQLVSAIRRLGISFDQPVERRIVPLRIRDGDKLDEDAFTTGLNSLRPDVGVALSVQASQLVVVDDEDYADVVRIVTKSMDELPDEEVSIRASAMRPAYIKAHRLEGSLLDAVRDCIRGMSMFEFALSSIVTAVAGYVRIMRRRILRAYGSIAQLNQRFMPAAEFDPLSEPGAEQLYQSDVARFEISLPTSRFGVWLPHDADGVRHLVKFADANPMPLAQELLEGSIARYIIPQMLAHEKPRSYDVNEFSIRAN